MKGGALGTLFAKQGHPVMFSSLHPEQLKDLVASAGPTAQAGTVEQAVEFGDVILLVVPYTVVEQIGKDYGKALAAKRLVIDVSNPIARRDGDAIVKQVAEQGGAGLVTAKLLPGAHLVRAFNAINYLKLTAGAHRAGEPIGVPIASDDPQALALAEQLIKEIGFEPVPVGGLAMGKYSCPARRLPASIPPQRSGRSPRPSSEAWAVRGRPGRRLGFLERGLFGFEKSLKIRSWKSLDFLPRSRPKSKLFNGLRGFFAGRIFACPFPLRPAPEKRRRSCLCRRPGDAEGRNCPWAQALISLISAFTQ